MTYEPLAPVARAPLAAPVGYASTPPETINSPPPLASDGNSAYGRSGPPPEANMVWHPSPRWIAITGNDRTVIQQDPQSKFEAAQAKAAKVGVENLSEEDLDGLTIAQLKELRGY